MKKTTQTLFFLISIFSFSAYAGRQKALFENCDDNKDTVAKITNIAIGLDNSEPQDISIAIRKQGDQTSSSQISVKQTATVGSGRGILALLISAYVSNTNVTITRCFGNQIAGVTEGPE